MRRKQDKKAVPQQGILADKGLTWLSNDGDEDIPETFKAWIKVGIPKDSTYASDWSNFTIEDQEVTVRVQKDQREGSFLELEEKGIVIFTVPHRYLREFKDSSRYFALTVPKGLKGEDVYIGMAFHDREQAALFRKKVWSNSLLNPAEMDDEGEVPRENSLLSEETLLEIFSYLTAKDLCALGQTCARWNTLTQDNALWERLCRVEQWLPKGEEFKRKYHGSYKLCFISQWKERYGKSYVPKEAELLEKYGINNVSLTEKSYHVKISLAGSAMQQEFLCTLGPYIDNPLSLIWTKKELPWLGDDSTVHIDLWSSRGNEEFSRLRPLIYDSSDAFIFLFCKSDAATFNNLSSIYYPEVRKYMPKDSPIVLLGVEPSPSEKEQVSTTQALGVASKGYVSYMDVSMKDTKMVMRALKIAVQSALLRQLKKSQKGDKKCVVS